MADDNLSERSNFAKFPGSRPNNSESAPLLMAVCAHGVAKALELETMSGGETSNCSGVTAAKSKTGSLNSRCGHCGSVNIQEEEASREQRSSGDLMDSYMSSWRVEIADFPGRNNKDVYPVSAALTECKQHVLKPYKFILCLVGWKAWGQESLYSDTKCVKFLNIMYTLFVISCLLFFYWSTAHRCEVVEYLPAVIVDSTTLNTSGVHSVVTTPAVGGNGDSSSENVTIVDKPPPWKLCKHIITSFILPDILHFLAYLMGLWFFRIQNNEHLYALIEKVYIEVSMFASGTSVKKLTTVLRVYLLLGIVWVLLHCVRHVLFILIYKDEQDHKMLREPYQEALNALGLIYVEIVYITVLIVYGAICTLLRASFDRITLQLREKTQDLKDVMQDILNLKGSVSTLNGFMAKMVSLLLFVYCNMLIITSVIFYYNDRPSQTYAHSIKMWSYIAISLSQQIGFISFPFIQAGRLMTQSKKLKNMALEIRVFGYQNLSQIDRDSFLNFVVHSPIVPKIFNSSVHPSLCLTVITFLGLLIIFLIQTQIIAGGWPLL